MKKWLILTTAFTLSCVGKAMSADLVCGGNTAGLDAVGFKGGTITVDGVFFNNDKSTQSTASSGSGGGGPAGGGAFGLNGATAAINTGNQIITNGLASNTTFQIGGTSITITDQNNNNLLFTTGALSLNGVPFVTATATVKSVAGDSNISVSNNGNGGWPVSLNHRVVITTIEVQNLIVVGPTSQDSAVTNSTMSTFNQFQGKTTQSTFTITATSMSFASANGTVQTDGSSVSVNGISLSTNTKFFLPINGYSYLGNSSMTVSVATQIYYNSVVFEGNTSTPGNNFFVTQFTIPPGLNSNLSAVLRSFVVAQSSGTGPSNGDALDSATQLYTISWATAAILSSANPRTLTYRSQNLAFNVTGNSTSGGLRWAQNIGMSQLSTDLGPGNCVVYLRVLRDGSTDASTALSTFVGAVIELNLYP